MMNEKQMKTREEFQKQVGDLLEKDYGHDTWCWIRRRAGKHYEESYWDCEERGEEFGSSDLSNYIFELWKQYPAKEPFGQLGFWINGEICDLMDIPNTKATREHHNSERA